MDDLCGGGCSEFVERIFKPLQKRFDFGKICRKEGRFTGRDLRQLPDFSITMDQVAYAQTLVPVDIPRVRRRDRESLLTESERSVLRAKAGELNWLQSISRPDLAGAVSILQTSFADPRIKHLFEINRLIKEARQHAVQIRIRSIPCQQLMFVCTADSAWANCSDLSSHMGYLILAAHRDIDSGKTVPISVVGWKAHKQRRRVASTLAAETLATGVSMGALDWVRTFWEWLTNPRFVLRDWEQQIARRPALLLTDCKSVYDSLQQLWSSSSRADKRTSIDLAILREALTRDASKIRWIDTSVQLADSLTKNSASPFFLRSTLATGEYQIVSESLALERRVALKEMKGNLSGSERRGGNCKKSSQSKCQDWRSWPEPGRT